MPDVVVIGAGVMGAAVAHALAEAGAKVDLLEAGAIAGGTSGTSFAVDVSPVKTPRALFDLSVASVREHQALERASGASWRHPARWLEWSSSREGRERIAERSRRLRSWGHRAESISPARARELEPALALPDGAEAGVALYPDGAWYEPSVLARTLLDRASARGARVRTHDPVTVIGAGGGRTEVGTASGRRSSADRVVISAGPQAAELARLAGGQLPLRRVPGLIVTTTPAPTGLRAIVSADDLNLRPAPGDRVLVHSWIVDGELDPGPSWDNESALGDRLLQRARSLLPGLAGAELERARVAVRPVPADGLPLVGPIPEADGLYALVAHSAVQLAPILGRLAALEIGGAPQSALESFRPTELRAQDGGEALDESTRTMLSRMRLAASSPPPPAGAR